MHVSIDLEYWLENPRIISAPGFNEYEQKCYLFIYFFNFISVCMYVQGE